jgi:tetratricopeptide (TPR) repeat protein
LLALGALGMAPAEMIDPAVWRPHFEAWVDRALVEGEWEDARAELPALDADAPLRTLDALLAARLLRPPPVPALLEVLTPPVRAKNAKGAVLEVARMYARGEHDPALARLREPELVGNPTAAHLRAQLLDQSWSQGSPRQRLAAVTLYRYALSLSRSDAMAARARVRVAQLLLGLGFAPEASAELALHLEPPLAAPYADAAVLTFASAAVSAGHFERALTALERLDLSTLPREAQSLASAQRAEALLRMERFEEAIHAYRSAEALAPDEMLEPDARTRLAYALWRTGQRGAASQLFASVARADGESEPGLLAALLDARLELEVGDPADMRKSALQALESARRSGPVALAGAAAMIAQARATGTPATLPEPARAAVDFDTNDPEIGLLGYLVAVSEGPEPAEAQARGRLARLGRALPHGSVRALVVRELSHRVLSAVEGAAQIDPAQVENVAVDLDPELCDASALLLGLEVLYAAGRDAECLRWARALAERERRPIRVGLARWREALCAESAGESAGAHPETDAGPFAQALAALSAEALLERGEIEGAERIYEEALEALGEPLLLGPLLLRSGELLAQRGESGFAMQRILRGLALTESKETGDDPLRRFAVVTLSRLVQDQGMRDRLQARLVREGVHVDAWWQAAYRYLGRRAGVPFAPGDPSLFATAAAELDQAEELARKLASVAQGHPEPSASESAPAEAEVSASAPGGTPE